MPNNHRSNHSEQIRALLHFPNDPLAKLNFLLHCSKMVTNAEKVIYLGMWKTLWKSPKKWVFHCESENYSHQHLKNRPLCQSNQSHENR